MSNLLNIATSGLMAYRQQLTVTGENIANVNTEGYSRRSVVQVEMAGASGHILSANIAGQGVGVDSIRRAFDALMSDKTRQTTSTLSSLEAQLPTLNALEDWVTPGPGGLADMVDGFFAAVGGLAIAPDDPRLRSVLMEASSGLAASIADLGAGMESLKTEVLDRASQAVSDVNGLLKDLGTLHSRMAQTADEGALNPLMDKRDLILDKLSELIDINVSLSPDGIAEVRMGAMAGGPLLVDRLTYSRVKSDGEVVTVFSGDIDGGSATKRPTGGMLEGLSNAIGAINNALFDLNTWVGKLTNDINTVHRDGIDGNMLPGGDMFSLDGWKVQAAMTNRGNATAEVQMTGTGTPPEGRIRLTRDEAQGLWIARDINDNILGQGSSKIDLPGLQIVVGGVGKDGDILDLVSTNGQARNMRFMLTDLSQIAAAGSLSVATSATNSGSASLVVSRADATATTGTATLTKLGTTTASVLDAAQFLSEGSVGIIPANSKSATLASLGAQSVLNFTVPTAQIGAANAITFSLNGAAVTVDLTQTAAGGTPPAISDMADMATYLNDGTFLTTDGRTLAEVGVYASGSGGVLSLAAARGDFATSAQFGSTAGVLMQTALPPSDMMVFTREGRQISGPILTPAQAAALLVPENGFLPGAVYDTSSLDSPDGYRGMTISSATDVGKNTVQLPMAGQPATWSGLTSAAPTPQSSIAMAVDWTSYGELTIPEGASAKLAAQIINDNVDVGARATTRVLFDAPADGQVSFALAGDNLQPISLSGIVSNGNLAQLVSAVNSITARTGIRAELSSSGAQMMLVHDSGADITMTQFTHSTGATGSFRRVDNGGMPIDATDTVLGAGADAARFGGIVDITSDSPFSVTKDGVFTQAATNPLIGGMVSRTLSQAGSTQSFAFELDPILDGSAASVDGYQAAAAAVSYTMTVGDLEATVTNLGGTVTSGADIAKMMLAELRDLAPTSTITGAVLSQIPVDGTETAVALGDQIYRIRMVSGQPYVEGPEDGRVQAVFNSSNQLVISTVGGTLDGSSLRIPVGATNMAGFGISAVQAPQSSVIGQPIDLAAVADGTRQFDIEVGGATHQITVVKSGASISVSASGGFPGSVAYDGATQQISLNIPHNAGDTFIPAQTAAAEMGFGTANMRATIVDGSLRFTTVDGSVANIQVSASSLAGQRLTLGNLPDEDLVVVMRDPGAKTLASNITLDEEAFPTRPLGVRVIDASEGQIEVYDLKNGDSIATRWLDSNRSTVVSGFSITLNGFAEDGDTFTITPNSSGTGDARNIELIADLRDRDPKTGMGGFGELYNDLVVKIGGQVSATNDRIDTARIQNESALRAESEANGIDLDQEAANLLKQQQAYQANAQVMSVAKSLFDTLIGSMR